MRINKLIQVHTTKDNMKICGIPNLVYLIEGDPQALKNKVENVEASAAALKLVCNIIAIILC